MTTYLPTIKQLQYLVALHEHGHFGRAAESCFVSQSTLSAGIRELESLLGVTLVERSRRVVRFTPLGNAVVDKAHRLLREAEEKASAEAISARLSAIDITIARRVGDTEQLYGSVTSADIVDVLKSKGFDVDRLLHWVSAGWLHRPF